MLANDYNKFINSVSLTVFDNLKPQTIPPLNLPCDLVKNSRGKRDSTPAIDPLPSPQPVDFTPQWSLFNNYCVCDIKY